MPTKTIKASTIIEAAERIYDLPRDRWHKDEYGLWAELNRSFHSFNTDDARRLVQLEQQTGGCPFEVSDCYIGIPPNVEQESDGRPFLDWRVPPLNGTTVIIDYDVPVGSNRRVEQEID